MNFIILPNQLFDKKYLPDKSYTYILWEHPQYFTEYKYNKKRILMHRASMKYYQDYLKKAKFKNIKYYNFDQSPTKSELSNFMMFDSSDKLKSIKPTKTLESPNFLLTNKLQEAYREKTDKFFFHNFYTWAKKELDIIPNVKSKDKENRQRMPKDFKIPQLPSNDSSSKSTKKYIDEAIEYTNKNFPKNYGTTDGFLFPITHKTAKKWLKNFIQHKFANFGPYQDFINTKDHFLYHSCLSTSINMGLLNPSEIIKEITKPSIKNKIPINSYEGYIRQLFWREYQLYCYRYFDFSKHNYFKNNKSITKDWYEGTLKVDPVDDSIKLAFKDGYLHHIERLMVIGNYMNLSRLKPMDGFKWFMEFACDSYEWVMYQNVLDMVFCVTGGQTMRRPYISTSNYILNMSNYKKGDWCDTWDNLYRTFLKDNKKQLQKFRYYFRNL